MFQKNAKPNLLEKLIYGSSQIGLNAMYTLFASYILLFYTDVKGINPASVGTVILFCKIFDGFSDMIAGQYIDTHKGKYGHCIPILLKWSLPMMLSVVLTFLVPNTTTVLQLIFIFVTYNLFNTIFYTIVGAAAASLPSYAADDPNDRSQMLAYSMLFAAAMQVIVASRIMPLIEYFGGVASQAAWIKATLFFGVIGLVFLYLNAFFVKERVENNAPAENVLKGAVYAFKNKYWIYTLIIGICANVMLIFNLSVSVYYLKDVVGNLALIGDCVDYVEWKLGVRVQSVLFAANSVGQKIGQGLMTSLLGIFLSAVGYVGTLEVQSAATIAGIDAFFKFGPIVVSVIMGIFAYLFDFEKKLPEMRAEVAARNAQA